MRLNERPVIVFDVNETLLDLSALQPGFSEVLPPELMSLWFTRLLHNSAVSTLTRVYEPFDRLAVDALMATARASGADLGERAAIEVVDGMRRLPAHPDVVPALEHLRQAGLRLVTLTNSSGDVAADQIENAGLGSYFERLLSVEVVRQFKPAPATYKYAADTLGVGIEGILMVAAHAWDTTGAMRAGARAALVVRGGAGLGLLSETPGIVASDLIEVARAITARDDA